MKKKTVCTACGKAGTIRILTVRHGRTTREVELCDDCALLWGIGPEDTGLPMNIGDFYFPQIDDEEHDKECPLCGQTLLDIRITGSVGCSECYATFSRELLTMLKKDPEGVYHPGRIPEPLQLLRAIIHKQHIRGEQIHRALEQEDYEEAARLRDLDQEISGEFHEETGDE